MSKKKKLSERELIMLSSLIWLYDKLKDHMSSSGSTEEEDSDMAVIKLQIQEWT